MTEAYSRSLGDAVITAFMLGAHKLSPGDRSIHNTMLIMSYQDSEPYALVQLLLQWVDRTVHGPSSQLNSHKFQNLAHKRGKTLSDALEELTLQHDDVNGWHTNLKSSSGASA